MLTMEAAGALLLVCLGVALLLFFGCMALIFARTKIAPHSDCKRITDALVLQVDELNEKFKHRGKQAGGRLRGAQKVDEAEAAAQAEPVPAVQHQTSDFQRIVREHAMKSRLG